MFEELLSDLGKAFIAGLLTGSAFVAMRGAAVRSVRQYLRAPWKQDSRDCKYIERRMAAVLGMDVVGYSHLMNADEEGTHARLLNCRREVMEPKIREYRGRIVKYTDDGALIEFGSAVDAVCCALDMQQTMTVRNTGVPQSRRIELRMAVGLGGITVEPEDVYGHAVNLVARSERLAAPGGVCVSAAIGGLVGGTIGAEFVDLAAWNRELERRVADQVSELERVCRLKRFLAPQIAELIISSGDEKILESHRREITVVACDLRGFTAFSETAAPEDVMAVLREYQSGLGTLVDKFEGTVERFTGDGMMVWFNDPLPCADPCARATRMGIEMRDCVATLADKRRKLDHDLGFAVGMAHGYATLGRIGFERRFDYAAVGMVVNLAARLCGEARDGQILIDSRVRAAVESFATLEPVGDLALKGFNRPVKAFNLMCVQ